MSAIIAITCTLLAQNPEESARFYAALRDAQTTNMAAALEGRAAVRVDYNEDNQDVHLLMEGTLDWDEQNLLFTFLADDQKGRLFGRRMNTLVTKTKAYVLISGDTAYSYLEGTKRCNAGPAKVLVSSLIDLRPANIWFRPPLPASSLSNRPWTDFIGAHAPDIAQRVKSLELSNDGDTIIQSRRDYNGGSGQMKFSKRCAMNLTEVSYKFTDSRTSQVLHGTYEWTLAKGVEFYFPRIIMFERNMVQSHVNHIEKVIIETTDIDMKLRHPSGFFSFEKLKEHMAQGVVLVDREKRTGHQITGPILARQTVSQATTESLIQAIKSGNLLSK